MSSSFRINNKELLCALGLAQTVRTHQTLSESDHPSIMQDSYMISETDRKDHHSSTNSTIYSQRESSQDRGDFLFALDIDISEDRKDRIEVYSNDQPYRLARSFCKKHGINKEIAELISARIVDTAKAAVAKAHEKKEYAKRSQHIDDDNMHLGESQMFPKDGDEPVSEDFNSPTLACSKTTVMTDRDFNTATGTGSQFLDVKKGFSYVLESRTDDMFCNNTSRIGSRDDLLTRSQNDENASPKFEQEKRGSKNRFYDKAFRDIENKLKREAHYAEIYNQERYKECSFHPTLNENSIKLASKYRGNVNIEHLLILKGKINDEKRTVLKHTIRGQQSEAHTFKPEINERSKELDRINRPHYDHTQRFEDLYQEYRILHEKKVQLKASHRMTMNYTFQPNTGRDNMMKALDQKDFLERVNEDIVQRKARKIQEEEEKNQVNLTFRPQIIRGPENERRNPSNVDIGEYLHSINKQLQVKRSELQKAYEKELKERAPKCSEKSEKIVKCMIESSLKMIFDKLDMDKDGLVSSEDVKIETMSKRSGEFLERWMEEVQDQKQSLEQFCKICYKLLKGMDSGMKSYLIFEVPKEFEVEAKVPIEENLWNLNMTFQPQINENSQKLFEQTQGRQGRKAHDRLYSGRTKSEIRMKELKNRVIEEEMRECSFQPKINKDYAGDTEGFYKKALFDNGDCSFEY